MIDIRVPPLSWGTLFWLMFDNTLGGEYGRVNPTFPHEDGSGGTKEILMSPGRISFNVGTL